MFWKQKILISFALYTTLSYSAVFAAGCPIENGPSPGIIQYITDIKWEISQITKGVTANCGPKKAWNGIISGTNRVTEVLDWWTSRAFKDDPTSSNMYSSIFLDFNYSIQTALKGQSRAPVTRDGLIFGNLEKNTIIPAIKFLANTCNLTQEKQDALEKILARNTRIANFYKTVTLGNAESKGNTDELDIFLYYNPENTKACKNEYSFEEWTQKIMERIGKMSLFNSNSITEWKDAIALMRWSPKGGKPTYDAVAQKLLVAELSRQWLSGKAIESMLSRFTCVRNKEDGNETEWTDPINKAKAQNECTFFSVLGADKLTNWMKPFVAQAPTTQAVISRNAKYTRQTLSNRNIGEFYKKLQNSFDEESITNDEILSNLINLHIGISLVNTDIEKNIPLMSRACMTGNPSVVGACYGKKN